MSVPATTVKSKAVATATEKKQVRLITILKDDHNFDIVKEIVDHIAMLKRAKKIKPTDKHRMIMNYNLTLLQFCMPKMKLTEDKGDGSKPINFQINLGGTSAPAGPNKTKGVSITIPTKQNPDGTYAVDSE